jgi:CBS domain containing-hemolysin-like protein
MTADRPDAPEETARPSLARRLLRGLRRSRKSEALRDTIETLIESAAPKNEEIAPDEKALLRNILKLHGVTARDVMVPRADIVAVAVDTPLRQVVDTLRREAHSRLPVYRGSLDEIVGMIHVKDLFAFWDAPGRGSIAPVVRKVLFAAPSMGVLDLLKEMRRTRIHMALVVDEFGGVDGLVTIENLVEQIVGEIDDEHDEDTPPAVTEERPGVALADARLAIGEFESRYGRVLTEEERAEVDTLGGLVFYLANRVPARGELIRHSSGIEFEIVEADARRVKTMRLRHLPIPPAPEESA